MLKEKKTFCLKRDTKSPILKFLHQLKKLLHQLCLILKVSREITKSLMFVFRHQLTKLIYQLYLVLQMQYLVLVSLSAKNETCYVMNDSGSKVNKNNIDVERMNFNEISLFSSLS